MPDTPAPQQPGLTPEHIRRAAASAREILSGASPQRTLELMDDLVVAKIMLRLIADGSVRLHHAEAPPPENAAPPPPPDPENDANDRAQRQPSSMDRVPGAATERRKKATKKKTGRGARRTKAG